VLIRRCIGRNNEVCQLRLFEKIYGHSARLAVSTDRTANVNVAERADSSQASPQCLRRCKESFILRHTMAATPLTSPDSETLARLRRGFLAPSMGSPTYLERNSILCALSGMADLVQHGAILDIGCGVKPYEPLLSAPGDRWLGTDNPPTMQVSYGHLTLADVFADCQQLPFRDSVFDTVVCTQVLEHVAEPQRLMREIARVMRPGGILLLTAPMLWPLHEEPYDFYRYTRHGLRMLVNAAGLTVVRETQRGYGASALGQAFLDLHFNGFRHCLPGKIYIQAVCRCVNALCAFLDRIMPARRLALGWAVAAQKPAKAPPQTDKACGAI